MPEMEVDREIRWWDSYWGELVRDEDPRFPSILFGYETVSPQNAGRAKRVEVTPVGACFGFLARGAATVATPGGGRARWIDAQMYFSTSNGAVLELEEGTQIVLMQAVGYRGLDLVGGPIEEYGRLRYIDSCSDTMLVGPPTLGDPCINHLHFPPGVTQTAHSHPSTRFGIVCGGQGICRCGTTPSVDLRPGRLFYIPRDAIHGFVTSGSQSMDVIAYHPDTDFGPTHQDHPMINRTLVDGVKIDNRAETHTRAVVIAGRGGVAAPDSYRPT